MKPAFDNKEGWLARCEVILNHPKARRGDKEAIKRAKDRLLRLNLILPKMQRMIVGIEAELEGLGPLDVIKTKQSTERYNRKRSVIR